MSIRPSNAEIDALPIDPLRILVSACVAGIECANDGRTRTELGSLSSILALANVEVERFCPEHHAFGTPRELCDIEDGDGFDVLDGKARVLTASGVDWTTAMLASTKTMVELAEDRRVHLAILMDTSAACGSQVIYAGDRALGRRLPGQGVCAAALIRRGIRVLSHRDHRSLERIRHRLDPAHVVDPEALDYHETAWYRHLFGR